MERGILSYLSDPFVSQTVAGQARAHRALTRPVQVEPGADPGQDGVDDSETTAPPVLAIVNALIAQLESQAGAA